MTAARIREFVLSELLWEGPPDELRDDTSLLESGVLDSLGIAKLTAFIESEFGLQLAPDEILPRNFETIGVVADFVDAKRSAEPPR